MVLGRTTNEYAIRCLWTNDQIAKALVKSKIVEERDYNMEEDQYVIWTYDIYTTSDGEEFKDYNEAVAHENWWLSQEVNDGE